MFGSGHFSADGRISYRTACALLGRDEGRHLPGGQVSLVIRFETITFSSKDKTSSLSLSGSTEGKNQRASPLHFKNGGDPNSRMLRVEARGQPQRVGARGALS